MYDCEARPTNLNYYTIPHDPTKIRKIQELTTTVTGFKRIQFHNHQNLGFDELMEPLNKSFETEGIWIDIPGNVYWQYMKPTGNTFPISS